MKKLIALGDTHARTVWKQIVEKEKDADVIVFIGDYFDDYAKTPAVEQLTNFLEICELKTTRDKEGKETILIIGNHDYHYMNNGTWDCYSGFQREGREMFNNALTRLEKLLQIAYLSEDDTIYSHAGVTNSFLDKWYINSKNPKVIVQVLNRMFFEHPDRFKFYENDRTGYGDNVNQSPIWVRPASLGEDKIDGHMVIGHTKLPQVGFDSEMNVHMIDCLDSTNQYLIFENGEYKTGEL